MQDETRREWSLALAAALTVGALWGLHGFCDAFVAGELPYPARGEMPTPARTICWRWLGAVTWLGAAGLGSLGLAWGLPRLWSGAPVGLIGTLARAGRLVSLLLLGGLALTAALYGRFGA